MYYCIASYNRPECRTVKTLRETGVKKEDIIIATQNATDYLEYKTKHDCDIIFERKDCAAGNRNTLLDYVDGPCLLLDDDITGFMYYDGKWKTDNEASLDGILNCFDIAKNENASLFGVSANSNSIITRNRFEIDIDVLLQGSVIGVLDKDIRFNDKWKMVEDYEVVLRTLRAGKHVIRHNYLCAKKPQNGTNSGGLHDRYAEGQLPYWIERLAKVYPEFKPNKKKDGGQIKHGR